MAEPYATKIARDICSAVAIKRGSLFSIAVEGAVMEVIERCAQEVEAVKVNHGTSGNLVEVAARIRALATPRGTT